MPALSSKCHVSFGALLKRQKAPRLTVVYGRGSVKPIDSYIDLTLLHLSPRTRAEVLHDVRTSFLIRGIDLTVIASTLKQAKFILDAAAEIVELTIIKKTVNQYVKGEEGQIC